MANEQNLKPIKTLSSEEAKKRGSAGGKRSVEVRRAKKTMKEMLDYLLEKEITNKAGEKASTQEAITVSLINQALKGNVKAWEVIRDTMGEKPVDKQEIKTNQPAVLSEYSEKKIEEVLKRIKNSTYD